MKEINIAQAVAQAWHMACPRSCCFSMQWMPACQQAVDGLLFCVCCCLLLMHAYFHSALINLVWF